VNRPFSGCLIRLEITCLGTQHDNDLEKPVQLTMSTLRCSNDAYRHIFKRSSTGSLGKSGKEVGASMVVVWA
jgi:hypothetical protein